MAKTKADNLKLLQKDVVSLKTELNTYFKVLDIMSTYTENKFKNNKNIEDQTLNVLLDIRSLILLETTKLLL